MLLFAGLVALAVVALLVLAATKPNTFRVARIVRVTAPPDKLYPHVIDFHRWIQWSPYEGIDADLKRTYDGPPSGPGAVYGWQGAKPGPGACRLPRPGRPITS